MKIKKAVILAGGYGTRFMPFTKTISKVMLPVVDTPVIQYIVQEAYDSGIEEVLIVVGIHKKAIMDHFKHNAKLEKMFANKPDLLKSLTDINRFKVHFKSQRKITGTAGALKLTERFTKKEPFLLMFADDFIVSPHKPASKQLMEAFEKTGHTILGCKQVSKELAPSYSCVDYDQQTGNYYNATRIVEKPKPQNLTSTLCTLGRYIIKPELFPFIKQLKPNRFGELNLMDAVSMLLKHEPIVAVDFEGVHYDMGNKLEYIKTITELSLQHSQFQKPYLEFLTQKLSEMSSAKQSK